MKLNRKNFCDPDFAQDYRKKHSKILQKLGDEYAEKLKKRKFLSGEILDSGCGSGEMLIRLAFQFTKCRLIGIDLSEPLLEYANHLKGMFNLNNRVQFIKGDVMKLPFNKNSFDVVFNVNMAHLMSDPIAMLNEMERVLKPDGHIFIRDLRYSWLKMFESEIKYAFDMNKAKDLIDTSNIKPGNLSANLLWWNFETS